MRPAPPSASSAAGCGSTGGRTSCRTWHSTLARWRSRNRRARGVVRLRRGYVPPSRPVHAPRARSHGDALLAHGLEQREITSFCDDAPVHHEEGDDDTRRDRNLGGDPPQAPLVRERKVLHVELDEHVHVRVGLGVTARTRSEDCHAESDPWELGAHPPAQVGDEAAFNPTRYPNWLPGG